LGFQAYAAGMEGEQIANNEGARGLYQLLPGLDYLSILHLQNAVLLSSAGEMNTMDINQRA